MQQWEWDSLLFALESQKCIVLLGAGASTLRYEGKERPISECLAMHLEQLLMESDSLKDWVHHDPHSLLYAATVFEENRNPNLLRLKTKQFFDQLETQPNELQELIASLPIGLVINTSPDNSMAKAFEEQNKHPEEAFYIRHRDKEIEDEHNNIKDPHPKAPLIYHLFGMANKPNSLILTEKERILFVEDVIQHNNAIPNALLKYFQDDTVLLLFGFDFEQWHMRILPRALFSRENKRPWAISYNIDEGIVPQTAVFFQKQYNMTFLPEQTPLAFLRELKSKWEAEQEKKRASKSAGDLINVLYLYNENDRNYQEEIERHLVPLKQKYSLKNVDIHEIGADEKLEGMSQKINEADIVIFLVSADALADEDLINIHIKQVMQRRAESGLALFAVVLRPCGWDHFSFVNCVISLDKKDRTKIVALSSMANKEEGYQEMATQFDGYLKRIKTKKLAQ